MIGLLLFKHSMDKLKRSKRRCWVVCLCFVFKTIFFGGVLDSAHLFTCCRVSCVCVLYFVFVVRILCLLFVFCVCILCLLFVFCILCFVREKCASACYQAVLAAGWVQLRRRSQLAAQHDGSLLHRLWSKIRELLKLTRGGLGWHTTTPPIDTFSQKTCDACLVVRCRTSWEPNFIRWARDQWLSGTLIGGSRARMWTVGVASWCDNQQQFPKTLLFCIGNSCDLQRVLSWTLELQLISDQSLTFQDQSSWLPSPFEGQWLWFWLTFERLCLGDTMKRVWKSSNHSRFKTQLDLPS